MWERNCEKNDHDPAEIGLLLDLQYGMTVSGPITAAILMPVFAIESFLRLCAEVILAEQTNGAEGWRLALSRFDKRKFSDRLSRAITFSGATPIPEELAQSVKNLIDFRNDLVHDAPLWNIPGGGQVHVKYGETRLLEEENAFGGEYPLLHTHVMPLKLEHAKRAVAAHDGIVNHIMEHGGSEFMTLLDNRAYVERGSKLILSLGGDIWEKADLIGEFWDTKILPWFERITIEERKNFIHRWTRKSRVKVVK